jgi:DNA-binding NarL/FixJ family response regulator
MSALKILLAEDHALVRAGVRSLLEAIAGIEIIGEAADGHAALQAVAKLHPDLVLLDISMPGLNGLEVAARITRDHPRTKVLMLSMHTSEEYVHRALQAGAAGYLLKDAERAELELALRAVARGDAYVSPAVAKPLAEAYGRRGEAPPANPLERLTSRQREILQLVAEGLTTKEIARKLSLSVKTVETHRTQLMRRLEIHDVAGLVRYAIRAGLISPER